jgi:hypothetical protein
MNMGTRTLVGHEAGSDKPLAVLFCSTTMIAFGRVIHGDEDDMRRSKRTGGITVRIVRGAGVYTPGVDLHVKPHELHLVGPFDGT